MEPEQQPMEVHDPSKIPNAPQQDPRSVLAGTIPIPEGQEGLEGEALEVPPKESLATAETDLGPGEATAEKVESLG